MFRRQVMIQLAIVALGILAVPLSVVFAINEDDVPSPVESSGSGLRG